ncbi:hypothetical protein [Salinithrix halophila]|uniref:DUF4025 domain-containing protein n=1 Tax=Salinithrix halophila TaxID=1485204 RepID=A0ABV8JL84_9BACL
MTEKDIERNDYETKNEENINSNVQFAYEQSGELTDMDVEKGRRDMSEEYGADAKKNEKKQ